MTDAITVPDAILLEPVSVFVTVPESVIDGVLVKEETSGVADKVVDQENDAVHVVLLDTVSDADLGTDKDTEGLEWLGDFFQRCVL